MHACLCRMVNGVSQTQTQLTFAVVGAGGAYGMAYVSSASSGRDGDSRMDIRLALPGGETLELTPGGGQGGAGAGGRIIDVEVLEDTKSRR